MTTARRMNDDEAHKAASATGNLGKTDSATDEDTEGQSLHNYELVRAMSRERATEAARFARDAARAREARDAKRSGR
jgi:hypothetical protein